MDKLGERMETEPVEGREIKGGRVEEGGLQERKRDGWAEGAVLSGGRLELTWAPLFYTPSESPPTSGSSRKRPVVTSTLMSTSLAFQSVTGTPWVLSSYVGTAGSYP